MSCSDEEGYQPISQRAEILINLASGAAAGAIAKSTIAPLDRCKISFQTNKERYNTKAALMYLKQIYKNDGFAALWRGNSATMVRILPYAAIQFSSHEQWKKVLGTACIKQGEEVRYLELRRFLAGSLAGVTSQSLTYPLDIARARMAVTNNSEFSTLRKVTYGKEGLSGFYRGYLATILGIIPYAGASFFIYESLKQKYTEMTNRKLRTRERLSFGASAGICGQLVSYPLDVVRRRMQTTIITGKNYKTVTGSFLTILRFGASAGICGQLVSYPLDVFRRRMQTTIITGKNYKTVTGSFSMILREEGLRGCYKGVTMNWFKGPIATGISFATFELVRDILTEFHRQR